MAADPVDLYGLCPFMTVKGEVCACVRERCALWFEDETAPKEASCSINIIALKLDTIDSRLLEMAAKR